jgi:UDP-N-acetylmuramyl pentapeptide phosphotransferase/UDP-N-acetylglucosamine-1-phosphate transferase
MLLSLGLSITIFLSTALLTWGWIKIAQKKKINDSPERRRLHASIVPRAGGIAIALVLIIASIWLFSDSGHSNFSPVIVLSLISYGILGFWDDLRPMPARMKLFLHLLVAAIVFLAAVFLSGAATFTAFIIAMAYLLFVNIWNFMDGSNGMVGMQSICMTTGFLVFASFTPATNLYALAFAACCLGFIPFNFPVARVFLGDVGSHVLGAAIVGLGLLAYSEGQWTGLEMLSISSALWIDATLTFIRRAWRGFKVTDAHRSHLYQYAIRSGRSHAAVCCYSLIWTVCMIFIIGMSRQLPLDSQRVALLVVIALGCALHQWLRLFVLKCPRLPRNALVKL